MTLEQQVASLELSRKLKELGYPQEGLFWWKWTYDNYNGYDKDDHILIYGEPKSEWKAGFCVAPTIAELWQYLPQYLPNHTKLEAGLNEELHMGKNDPKDGRDDYTWVSYGWKANFNDFEGIGNIANSVAKMLIWLVENKYIDSIRAEARKEGVEEFIQWIRADRHYKTGKDNKTSWDELRDQYLKQLNSKQEDNNGD